MMLVTLKRLLGVVSSLISTRLNNLVTIDVVNQVDSLMEINISTTSTGTPTTPGYLASSELPGTTPGYLTSSELPGTTPGYLTSSELPGTTPGYLISSELPGTTPGYLISSELTGATPGRSTNSELPGSTPGNLASSELPGTTPGNFASSESEPVPLTESSSSSDRIEWIKRLDVTDPDFYSVFNDSELYRLFPSPVSGMSIYVWDDEEPFRTMVKECTQEYPVGNITGEQYATEMYLYDSIVNSSLRVYSKDEALIHYVPFYLRWCSDPYRHEIDKIVLNSPSYLKYRGMNFLTFWNHYVFRLAFVPESEQLFAGEKAAPDRPLAFQICGGNSVVPDMCNCRVLDPQSQCAKPLFLGSPNQDLTVRPWPAFEKYANFTDYYYQTRHFNFVFVGQADGRYAYKDRVSAAVECGLLAEPSIYIQTSGGVYELKEKEAPLGYMNCPAEVDLNSTKSVKCLHNFYPAKIHHDVLLQNSKYGWHHRGDEHYSGRLTDLINSLTLPVITSVLLADTSLPYQCSIPWDAMTLYVPPQRYQHGCDEVVETIMNIPPIELEKKLRLLYYYRPYYVHTSLSWVSLLREIVVSCLPVTLLGDFGLSLSDFLCPYANKLKSHRFPKVMETDEPPNDYYNNNV